MHIALMKGIDKLGSKLCSSAFEKEYVESRGGGFDFYYWARLNVYFYSWYHREEYLDRPQKLLIKFHCPIIGATKNRMRFDTVIYHSCSIDPGSVGIVFSVEFIPGQEPKVQYVEYDYKFSYAVTRNYGDTISNEDAKNDLIKAFELTFNDIKEYCTNALRASFLDWENYSPMPIPNAAGAYTMEHYANQFFMDRQKANNEEYALNIPFNIKISPGGNSPEIDGSVWIQWPKLRLVVDNFSLQTNKFTATTSGELVFEFDVLINKKWWAKYAAQMILNLDFDFAKTGERRIKYKFELPANQCNPNSIRIIRSGEVTLLGHKAEQKLNESEHPYQSHFMPAIYQSFRDRYLEIRRELQRRSAAANPSPSQSDFKIIKSSDSKDEKQPKTVAIKSNTAIMLSKSMSASGILKPSDSILKQDLSPPVLPANTSTTLRSKL